MHGIAARGPTRLETATDRQGRFELYPLFERDAYEVLVSKFGYAPAAGDESAQLRWRAGGAPELGEIALRRKDATIQGRVVYNDGTPAVGARVEAFSGETVLTGHDGTFRLAVVSGEHHLTASVQDVPESRVAASAPVDDVTIVLPYALTNDTAPPSGTDHTEAQDLMRELGFVLKMFAGEHPGSQFPAVSATYGVFTPDLTQLYPDYVGDGAAFSRLKGGHDVKWAYTGHLLMNEQEGLAYLDAYRAYGPQSLQGEDIEVAEGTGNAGASTLYVIREGIERFIITDINDPHASSKAQADIPIMWELPATRDYAGGHVLYLDGHTEWRPYPGPFPMTETFNARLEQIMIDAGTAAPNMRGEAGLAR
jgi:hypothetical protein